MVLQRQVLKSAVLISVRVVVHGAFQVAIRTLLGEVRQCNYSFSLKSNEFRYIIYFIVSTAYEIARKLLDDKAYDELVSFRQQITIVHDDGTTNVVSADRVQVILGGAISSALDSAERFGANLCFESDSKHYYKEETQLSDGEEETDVDIVALFAGAHTSELFDGLKEEMNIQSWPELRSDCKMWLQIKESEKNEAFTTRHVEVGAEKVIGHHYPYFVLIFASHTLSFLSGIFPLKVLGMMWKIF